MKRVILVGAAMTMLALCLLPACAQSADYGSLSSGGRTATLETTEGTISSLNVEERTFSIVASSGEEISCDFFMDELQVDWFFEKATVGDDVSIEHLYREAGSSDGITVRGIVLEGEPAPVVKYRVEYGRVTRL